MKRLAITLLIINLLISSSWAAAEKKKNRPIKKQQIAWSPSTFKIKNGKLPVNYKGIDSEKFYTLFVSKVDALKKGEFETTAEYEARTANPNSILDPINTNDLYAFQAIMMFKYNPETAKYETGFVAPCSHGSKLPPSCHIDNIRTDSSKYIGTNSYGASTTITKIDSEDFYLLFSTNSKMYSFIDPQTKFFNDSFPVPIEKAKTLTTSEIKMLLVGNVKTAKLIKNISSGQTPTIEKPFTGSFTDVGIEFDFKKLIYYYPPTGEILFERDLDEPSNDGASLVLKEESPNSFKLDNLN